MLAELTRIEAGWPLAASLAATVAAQGLLAGRRRMALNEALHELRRPLQALVLSLGSAEARGVDLSQQAALALERLDREINGGVMTDQRELVGVGGLLEAAIRRWQRRAALTGASLHLREASAEVSVSGDRAAITQALDNVIMNALEHGGPRILVRAELAAPVVRFVVADSGRRESPRERRRLLRQLLASLSGRRRRGHGLRVVRRVAAAHGGHFQLRRLEAGAEATIELPLAGEGER
jgi:signal transduction histidine kinase